jgi:hypothetical protein
MQDAIREIIEGIDPGLIFDSHFVIDQLILTNTTAYYDLIRSTTSANAAQIHGRIGKVIKKQDDLVESIGRSWSMHIHGSPGECEAWRRL